MKPYIFYTYNPDELRAISKEILEPSKNWLEMQGRKIVYREKQSDFDKYLKMAAYFDKNEYDEIPTRIRKAPAVYINKMHIREAKKEGYYMYLLNDIDDLIIIDKVMINFADLARFRPLQKPKDEIKLKDLLSLESYAILAEWYESKYPVECSKNNIPNRIIEAPETIKAKILQAADRPNGKEKLYSLMANCELSDLGLYSGGYNDRPQNYLSIYPLPVVFNVIFGRDSSTKIYNRESFTKYISQFTGIDKDVICVEPLISYQQIIGVLYNRYLFEMSNIISKYLTYELYKTESYTTIKTLLERAEKRFLFPQWDNAKELIKENQIPLHLPLHFAVSEYLRTYILFPGSLCGLTLQGISNYIKAPIDLMHEAIYLSSRF